MEIEIEKNIPLITERTVKSDGSFVATMEIGDSFKYPKISRHSIMNNIKKYCIKNNLEFKFTTRSIKPDNENIRVWRIK